ncbi:hypothetical protein BX600DRAFT_26256 [Xylariales sp. PMI_506]|nr:hypothetical protein BX600DRAFT_26256 [Xylariales sp. PMI_506]
MLHCLGNSCLLFYSLAGVAMAEAVRSFNKLYCRAIQDIDNNKEIDKWMTMATGYHVLHFMRRGLVSLAGNISLAFNNVELASAAESQTILLCSSLCNNRCFRVVPSKPLPLPTPRQVPSITCKGSPHFRVAGCAGFATYQEVKTIISLSWPVCLLLLRGLT